VAAVAPPNECRAPAGTALKVAGIDVSPNEAGDCSWRAVKAALERSVTIDVSGRGCGEVFSHRESFSVSSESSCTFELILRGKLARDARGWAFDEDQVELRSHCEKGPSCRQALTTERPGAARQYTTSECLTRLQAEVAAGRLLQECYDHVAGEAGNDSLRECDLSALTREWCGD
jgi:hypothetical protein